MFSRKKHYYIKNIHLDINMAAHHAMNNETNSPGTGRVNKLNIQSG